MRDLSRYRSVFNMFSQLLDSLNATKTRRRLKNSHQVESLEIRQLMTADFEILKDINAPAHDSSLQGFTIVNDHVFFHTDTELWKTDATESGTSLVRKIRNVSGHASFGGFQNVNGMLYFSADDGIHGSELWKSDGTESGTTMVADINPGIASSSPRELIEAGGELFLLADDGTHGSELWKSDGTESGTTMVADINPGIASSAPQGFLKAGDGLFFRANDGTHGPELWHTDGTPTGTQLVMDLLPGNAAVGPYEWPGHALPLGEIDGVALFAVKESNGKTDLWRSDGTAEGTTLVKDFNSIDSFNKLNGKFTFLANDGISGKELWSTDGTSAGTKLLKDVVAGANSSSIFNMTVGDGFLYFATQNPDFSYSIWKSDGTTEGTVLAKEIASGFSTNLREFTIVNGTLYFRLTSMYDRDQLWRSDGTEAGTIEFLPSQTKSDLRYLYQLTPIGDTLYFSAYAGIADIELWKTDGTAAGTSMVLDVFPGPVGSQALPVTRFHDKLLFTAFDELSGKELWVTDGTAAGTSLVKDITPGRDSHLSSDPVQLTDFNGTLYFFASDTGRGLQLWKSDGTPESTQLVTSATFWMKPDGRMIQVSGSLYFIATSDASGRQLWKIDGSTGVPQQISNWHGAESFGEWVDVNGTLYFEMDDRVNGHQIWKTDGSLDGTVMVSQQYWADFQFPARLTNVNGTLFFTASDGEHGIELWKSDGTENGTVMVKDIVTGIKGSEVNNLISVNGTLYFTAKTEQTGTELWKSDGTSEGTLLVADLNSGSEGSSPSDLVNLNGTLYYLAYNRASGVSLYKSDGTPSGTMRVNNSEFGLFPPMNLTVAGDTLFFTAYTEASGTELWKSDGTNAGTSMVRDIVPGPESDWPHAMRNVNGKLYFAIDDRIHGTELWTSDGTEEGTHLAFDFSGDAIGSDPAEIISIGDNLYVIATTAQNGREVFVAREENLTPTGLALSSSSVEENLPVDTSIGSFSTSDPNAADSHTYSLVSGAEPNDNESFMIDGDVLKTTRILNFEVQRSYSILVRTTDPGGKFTEQTFTINVTDINEAPAVRLSGGLDSLGDFIKTTSSVKIADVIIDDDNLGTNALSLSGPDASYFTLAGRQLFLKAGTVINRKTKPSYSYTITVDDPTIGVSADAFISSTLSITDSSTRINGPEPTTFLQRPVIEWSPVGGAAKYYVWIRNSSTRVTDYVVATSNTASYTPTADLGIGNYIVWVKPVGVHGESAAWSSPYAFQVKTPVSLQTPLAQQLTSTPSLQWTPLPGAVKYDLWIDNLSSRQSQVVRIANLRGTSWKSAADLPMGSYRAWIRGIDVSGTVAQWSPAVNFMVLPTVKQIAPVSSSFDSAPEFSWAPVAGAAAYNINIRNADTNAVVVNHSVMSGTTFTPVSGLPLGRYVWNVYAVTSTRDRSPVATTSEFFVRSMPTLLTPLASTSQHSPQFSWTPVAGAASYSLFVTRMDVYRKGVVDIGGLHSTNYTSSKPLSAGTYRVWVRAISASGVLSYWSNPSDFTIT